MPTKTGRVDKKYFDINLKQILWFRPEINWLKEWIKNMGNTEIRKSHEIPLFVHQNIRFFRCLQ